VTYFVTTVTMPELQMMSALSVA